MEFTDVGQLSLDSNKRFSWTCMKMTGGRAINQGKSVSIDCIMDIVCKTCIT